MKRNGRQRREYATYRWNLAVIRRLEAKSKDEIEKATFWCAVWGIARFRSSIKGHHFFSSPQETEDS
jgi:hypothetical protein